MHYEIDIIRKNEQSTSSWSGGITTQLAIYPGTSDYKERNFKWRLSSARVDIEESVFTSLPGIWRHIMIIEGEMELRHEGHHSILLKPFEQDSFSGGWTTQSKGRARDFNLMLGQGSKGKLETVFISKGMNAVLSIEPAGADFANAAEGFYCTAGSINVTVSNGHTYTLNEGDLMLIYMPESDECISAGFSCTDCAEGSVIRSRILY